MLCELWIPSSPRPDCPVDYTVVAADGPSLPPDTQSSVRHFVIDTGHAILTYGTRPKAELDFSSRFCFRSEDLYLDPLADCPIEDLRIGDSVVLEGESNRYFSMISDIQLRITDSRLQASPTHEAPPLVAHALTGTASYATVEAKPIRDCWPMIGTSTRSSQDWAAEASCVLHCPAWTPGNRYF